MTTSAIEDVELVGDEDLAAAAAALAPTNPPNPRAIVTPAQRVAILALVPTARFDEPLRRHCTLKLGGPADAYCEPTSPAALAALVRLAAREQLPLVVIGGGSNLLVRDGGVRGIVLCTGGLRAIEHVPPHTIRVEAGVSTGKVLALATRHELGGVEFLGGVPGSIGGGLIMNAGTYLGELKDVAVRVDSVRLADGELVTRDNAACKFRYRHSELADVPEIVVGAELVLRPRPRAEIEAEVKALRKRRSEREPKKVASNGSTFKNPPNEFAGRLIEAAGCKGWHEGDAVCSPVHANWLVNTGHATATQLLALIARVRAEVARVHGVELELEVKIIGED